MRTTPSRPISGLPALLLPILLAAGTSPAAAQVTTSQQALDALGSGRPAAPAHPAPAPKRHRAVAQAAPRPAPRAGKPARVASAHPPAATIPGAPPPPPVFRAPVINVPLHPPPPPPPVPVVQTAVGQATPLAGGMRISFGPGSADLNPATMQALHTVATQLKANPAVRIDLDAFGSVTEDDPSTPRRLSFERGIAARAVLINDGIASTRIYLRVIGAAPAAAGAVGVTADRIDLLLSAATPGAPSVAPSSAPTRATSSAGTAPGAASAVPLKVGASPSGPSPTAPRPSPAGLGHPSPGRAAP